MPEELQQTNSISSDGLGGVKKPLFKKWWFWAIIILIPLIVLFMYSHRNDSKKISNSTASKEVRKESKKDCPSDLTGVFTSAYMNTSDYYSITPLGNLNPPSHVFPTDHIYFNYRTGDTKDDKTYDRNIYALADMTLYQIEEAKMVYKADGSTYGYDYALHFRVCDGLELTMGHIQKLSEEVAAAVNEGKRENDSNSGLPGGYDSNILNPVRSIYKLSFGVKSGDVVGYVGGRIDNNQHAADLWTTYANPKEHETSKDPDVLCPLDLYNGSTKTELYSKLGDYRNSTLTPPAGEPLCGTVLWDLPGTIQGKWYESGKETDKHHPGAPEQLSLAHENNDPAIETISFGTDFAKQGKISFVPTTTSGTISRDFKDAKADGKIYCYQNIATDGGYAIAGKAIVQLTDDNHLKIEQQSGSCSASELFNKPIDFQR